MTAKTLAVLEGDSVTVGPTARQSGDGPSSETPTWRMPLSCHVAPFPRQRGFSMASATPKAEAFATLGG